MRRIVRIGDSHTWRDSTWHDEIRAGQTLSALLEQSLDWTEAIDLGVRGWGTGQQSLHLRDLGLRFQPDLVVLGFLDAWSQRNVNDHFRYSEPLFRPGDDVQRVLTNKPVLGSPALLAPLREARSSFFHPMRGEESQLMDNPFHTWEHPTPMAKTVAAWTVETETRFLDLREPFIRLRRSEGGAPRRPFHHQRTLRDGGTLVRAIEHRLALDRSLSLWGRMTNATVESGLKNEGRCERATCTELYGDHRPDPKANRMVGCPSAMTNRPPPPSALARTRLDSEPRGVPQP